MRGFLRQIIILYLLSGGKLNPAAYAGTDTLQSGCRAYANSARVTIPLHIPDEQPDSDTIHYGADTYANSGRIAVTTN